MKTAGGKSDSSSLYKMRAKLPSISIFKTEEKDTVWKHNWTQVKPSTAFPKIMMNKADK